MDHRLRAARYATMFSLFANGVLYATWGVSIPTIRDRFGLSEAVLAFSMAAVAIGGIVTMTMAARWIARYGSGPATVASAVLLALSAAPILLIGSFWLLLPCLFVFGIMAAANDVAANSQGAQLERLSGRSIIGSLHGSFSVGGLVGSLLGGFWATTSVPQGAPFYCPAAIIAVVSLLSARLLINESGHPPVRDAVPSSPTKEGGRPGARKRLTLFGTLAFSALMIEGAFYDWAAVYMRDVVVAGSEWVGAGYAGFAIGMATGRLFGDIVRDRWEHLTVFGASGLIAIAGLGLITVSGSPLVTIAGFGVTGLGMSNIIPILFSSAGKLAANAGLSASYGLAITTRLGYVGLLFGPLVIGPLADLVGLRGALLVLVVAILITCGGWYALSQRTGGVPWRLPHA